MASVGAVTRLISSQSFQPTSPAQTSLVPGRVVIRNGLRRPVAIVRRTFGSLLPANGLPGSDAPVAGSTRRIDPSSPAGSPLVRRSWLRNAPPWSDGSPHGLTGLPSWPQSTNVKLAPSPPLTYRAPSAPKVRSPIEWLGYCWHQSSISTCSGPVIRFPDAVSRERRPLTTHPSLVGPGGVGHGSDSTPGVPQRGAVPPIAASCA